MEDQLKSSSFAPMLTSSFASSFDGSSLDGAPAGYYYHSSSSADSSPLMAGVSSSFDSSPSNSPPFYGSFETSGSLSGSPQYYLQAESAVNVGLEQYQSVQEFFSTTTSPVATSNSMSHLLMEQQSPKQQQQQSVHIPGLNELTRLFNMAGKVEDKLAIQEKINRLLQKHLQVNKRQEPQQMLLQPQQQPQQITYLVDSNGLNANHTLITPPLSPNCDNIGMFMGKQNPMFVQQQSPLKQSNSGNVTRSMLAAGGVGHQVVKVEPLSPTLVSRKIVKSPFGEAANNNNNHGSPDNTTNSGLLLAGGGQSPSQNSSAKTAGSIYFEHQQQQYNGAQQYGGNLLLSDQSAPIPELASMDHQSAVADQQCTELKSMMVSAKPSKIGKGKGKGKGKKSASGKSAASMAGLSLGHGSPPQSQKRTAHLSAEFRYRTKLNDKISKLRSLVGQKVHLSKSAVLTRSIERIVKLQKLTIRLHESNLRLQSRLAKCTGGQGATNSEASKAAGAPLMSIKELTRSLSVGSGTTLLNQSGRGGSGQFGSNSQATIDIDLAKYIDSQMLSSPESDHLPSTIESTVNCSSSSSTSPASVPSVVSTAASQSMALNPTDEVFDFDQFLDQF